MNNRIDLLFKSKSSLLDACNKLANIELDGISTEEATDLYNKMELIKTSLDELSQEYSDLRQALRIYSDPQAMKVIEEFSSPKNHPKLEALWK